MMQSVLVAGGWGIVGLAVGVAVRAASVWLARLEGLEPGRRPWQTYGPVVLTGLLFGLFAWRAGFGPVLLIRSLWLAVLGQVIFFDFEHQLILDRVLLPAGVAALALSFFTPGLGVVQSLLSGLVTGAAFLLLAAVDWVGAPFLTGDFKVLFTLVVLAAAGLWGFVVWLQWSSASLTVTDQRVILEEGIFQRNSKVMPLDRVQDVSTRQTLLGRMLDYGLVEIDVAGSSEIFPYVRSPELLRDQVFVLSEQLRRGL